MQFYEVKHYFKNIYNTKSPCSIETQVLQDSSGSMFLYLQCYKNETNKYVSFITRINYFLMQLATNMCTPPY